MKSFVEKWNQRGGNFESVTVNTEQKRASESCWRVRMNVLPSEPTRAHVVRLNGKSDFTDSWNIWRQNVESGGG
jgi:hypothetical protein